MKEIRIDLKSLPCFTELGRQGENEARKLVFDCSSFAQEFGEGSAVLLHKRSGDEIPYIANTTQSGNTVEWVITGADTAFKGTGKTQLQWYVGETLAKTATFSTEVYPSLADGEEISDETKSALDIIAETLSHGGYVPAQTGRTPLDISDEESPLWDLEGFDIVGSGYDGQADDELPDGAYDIIADGIISNYEDETPGYTQEIEVSEGAILFKKTVNDIRKFVLLTDEAVYQFDSTTTNWRSERYVRFSDIEERYSFIGNYPDGARAARQLTDGLYYKTNDLVYIDTAHNNTEYTPYGLIYVNNGTHYAYSIGMKFGTLTGGGTGKHKAAVVSPLYNSYTTAETDALIAAAIADVSALIGGASQ